MKTNFLTTAWLGLSLLLPFCVGCNPSANEVAGTASKTEGKKGRIVLLNNTDSPYWDAARAGIKQAVIDLKLADLGISAGMDSNDGTEQGQIDKLRQYGTQSDIIAVVISPISSTNPAIADELEKLKKKGVIVGCFDSDLAVNAHPVRDFYVGTNNIVGGKVLGTAAKAIKADAEYVQFVGTDSQQNAIERMDGFSSVYGKGTEKDRKLDDGQRDRARDNVRDVMTRYPNVSLLVGIWSYNAPAITDVVEEKKARDRYKVVAFDAEQLAIQQMEKGNIDVMVVQNPFGMGYDSVKFAVAKHKGDEAIVKELFPNFGNPGGDIRDTGLKVVVPDSGSPITKEAFSEFGPAVEFTPFSEFQSWLKQYKLTSS